MDRSLSKRLKVHALPLKRMDPSIPFVVVSIIVFAGVFGGGIALFLSRAPLSMKGESRFMDVLMGVLSSFLLIPFFLWIFQKSLQGQIGRFSLIVGGITLWIFGLLLSRRSHH